jgi:enoyl-CoA hydratase/carnithine racemase
MAPPPTVRLELETRAAGAVARLTVDNAAKLNIVGSPLIEQLAAGLATLAGRDDLRAVVLTGAGDRAFIGGADIREMAALDAAGARAFITRLHGVCAAIRDLPVPVIARVNGFALGAGLEVAAACDLRVAAGNAAFGMPEVRVGIPSVIEAALLPALIGWGRTRELLLLGETIDAATALRWGLVERVIPAADLDAAVDAWVDALMKAGPRAIRLQKRLIRRWEESPMSAAIAAGIDSFADAYATDEPGRLMRAFLERPRG